MIVCYTRTYIRFNGATFDTVQCQKKMGFHRGRKFTETMHHKQTKCLMHVRQKNLETGVATKYHEHVTIYTNIETNLETYKRNNIPTYQHSNIQPLKHWNILNFGTSLAPECIIRWSMKNSTIPFWWKLYSERATSICKCRLKCIAVQWLGAVCAWNNGHRCVFNSNHFSRTIWGQLPKQQIVFVQLGSRPECKRIGFAYCTVLLFLFQTEHGLCVYVCVRGYVGICVCFACSYVVTQHVFHPCTKTYQ